MKVLKITDEILTKILRWIVTGLCIGIGVILFLRVLIRFLSIGIPFSWTDEVVEWMMAWMIFTAATLLVRYGDHFRVDILQTKFKDRAWLKILNILISLMGFAFFSVLLYYSALLVAKSDAFSPILKVSNRLPYLSMPVNCGLILLYIIRDIVTDIHKLVKRRLPAASIDMKSETL